MLFHETLKIPKQNPFCFPVMRSYGGTFWPGYAGEQLETHPAPTTVVTDSERLSLC